jgi:hypothetical protein
MWLTYFWFRIDIEAMDTEPSLVILNSEPAEKIQPAKKDRRFCIYPGRAKYPILLGSLAGLAFSGWLSYSHGFGSAENRADAVQIMPTPQFTAKEATIEEVIRARAHGK